MNWGIRLIKLIFTVAVFIMLRAMSILADFETVVITALSIIMCEQMFLNDSKD